MWYHAGALVRTLTVVVLVKVVTMIIIMRMFRFDPVSSLTSAVALAQITEYSLMFTGTPRPCATRCAWSGLRHGCVERRYRGLA